MADVLPGFLSDDEARVLRGLAGGDGWMPGRQDTGYDILPLQAALPATPGSLAARSLAPDREVHEVTPVVGTRLLFSVGAWIEPDA